MLRIEKMWFKVLAQRRNGAMAQRRSGSAV